jgi:prepilin-type N-terminal cleavage/methylation domain-containing protein
VFHPRHLSRRSVPGFSLIEILVVLVIVVALSAILANNFLGHSNSKNGKAHTPMERAHDTECMNNVHQVHLGIVAAQSSDADGKYPDTLVELKLPKEMLRCPVGKEPYVYDPSTGRVYCPHPGHQNYQ